MGKSGAEPLHTLRVVIGFNPVIIGSKNKERSKLLSLFLVPVIGVEPIRYRYHWILSPARLPIPSHRHIYHTTDILPQKSHFVKTFFEKSFPFLYIPCSFLSRIILQPKIQKREVSLCHPKNCFISKTPSVTSSRSSVFVPILPTRFKTPN